MARRPDRRQEEAPVSAVGHNEMVTSKAHPEPTTATVKSLYARAFRCARPGCSRPLYKQDNDTGELVLNSRVAHIHARRPGGPRWIEMHPEANRASGNLLLLCIEHSYEVDTLPDQYPAELLRDWKKSQLEEHDHAQRGWPLTDVQAGRVLEASSQAVEHHHAGAVLDSVRATERLALAAREARSGPAAQAAVWRATRARVQRGTSVWDQDGNTVHVEPSRIETEQHRVALLEALEVAAQAVTPLGNDVKVELAAIRVGRPALEPWAAWAAHSIDEVIRTSSRWPGLPELEDDDEFEESLSALSEAMASLGAAWRGEAVAQPPREPEPEPEPVARDPLQEHRALLERARPYARVNHLPYDGALRAELAAAAEQAASIPPILSAMAIDLSATCYLAASVAGNATDDELAEMRDQDSRRRPMSAAVHLLEESAHVNAKRDRPVPRDAAKDALVELCDSVDWADSESWDPDDANGHAMFWAWSRATSAEHVKDRLAGALRRRPEILLPLVTGSAPWTQTLDYDDNRTVGRRRRYRDIPPWFPLSTVVDCATTAEPKVRVRVDSFGETEGDEPQALLAQVLWLAENANVRD